MSQDQDQNIDTQGEANGMPISYSYETLPVTLESEMKRSYLDYAMSVIVGRALPDVRDGFKPVHRRVLYSMHELGNDFSHPTKKCARVVGDVIGKYHPHGDQAAYQTLVRLAQDFSMRYPLVDSQGNFGSIDGDGAAAMRYTECRLARIADAMLDDLDQDTVDFIPNFDNSEKEPVVLPAKLPNLLVNGSAGIAVGMATNIPPHNLNECIDACRHLLHNPDAGIDELIARMPAPDFPTGAIIYGLKDVHQGYRTGRGRVIMRAHTHFEELKNGRQALVVDDIPYQVNKSAMLEKILRLSEEKKSLLSGINDIRDESDRQGMRIVITVKRDASPQIVLNKLYTFTQMQTTFGVIMLAIVNGEPKTLTLKEILQNYIDFQEEVITRRTQFDLRKAREREHILEGMKLVVDHTDEVIHIIRHSEDQTDAKKNLGERFGVTDEQASAIVDARKMIVDGAVGMVEMALNRLKEGGMVELDEERKAAMVSNLLVVLCGNKDAQPVVNSGSLY